nr:hypothetical protein [Streptomyces sp. SID13726]
MAQIALVIAAVGVVTAVLVVVRLRRTRPAVALLSDFLLGAGLVGLTGDPSWTSLAVVSAAAAVRVLLNANLRVLDDRHRASAA